MKYIHSYDTSANYDADTGKGYPHVGYIEGTDTVIYMNEPDWSKEYLTFEALESGQFKLSRVNAAVTCQYSLDGGDTWTSLTNDTWSPTVSAGQMIMFKGNISPTTPYVGVGTFSSTGRFNAMGCPYCMFSGDSFYGATVKAYGTAAMFKNCTGLTDASNLSMPALTIPNGAYPEMFNGCTSLIKAPELPATTLGGQCYSNMFSGCTSLTIAPKLPCTALTNSECYSSMFAGCTSLTTAPELPSMTVKGSCYRCMFSGCTSLIKAPELPATTLERDCYRDMFCGCTALTTAPVLSAEILKNTCYQRMFKGCSSLSYIKMLATDISATNCLQNWVTGVAQSGTFVKNASMTSLPSGAGGIPTNWTVQDATV